MRYHNSLILEKQRSGESISFIFFWGHTPSPKKMTKACLSQWFDCHFEIDGVTYHTTEQYMMAEKALLFGDREVYERIMASTDPIDYKALGRKAQGFTSDIWDAHKYEIVLRGNLAKFSQNPPILEFLLNTGDSVLVEASPYDGVWGVKLAMSNERIGNPENWQGENLLGYALMETRDCLRSKTREV